MRGRETHVGQHVRFGLVEERSELGQRRAQLVSDPTPLRLGGLSIVLGKRGGDEGGDHAPALLPACARALRMNAAQTAARKLAQERSPERLGLGGADIHPHAGHRR